MSELKSTSYITLELTLPCRQEPGSDAKGAEEVELRTGSSRRSPHIGSARVSVHSGWLVNLTKPFALVLLYPIGPSPLATKDWGA